MTAYDTSAPQDQGKSAEELEELMAEAEITYGHGEQATGVYDPELARAAVDAVMGEGRSIEHLYDGCYSWLVEFTDQELEVLERQGYIELTKGPYTIYAEMS